MDAIGISSPLEPFSTVWWSLTTEVQFYLVLPLIFIAFQSRGGRILHAAIVLFMSVVFYEDPALADPWLLPSGILLLAVFYFGWRKIRSTCATAA